MCKTDFDWELIVALGGIKVYSSIQDLTDNRDCVTECGIVKVEVKLLRVVQEDDF